MVVTNEDRYAALEEKLKQAESALYGCRAMLNYVRRLECQEEQDDTAAGITDEHGLFPGQLPDPNRQTDCTKIDTEECIE
jgi:hypothetical protein